MTPTPKRGPARTYQLVIATPGFADTVQVVEVNDANGTDLKRQIVEMAPGDTLTITRTR